MHIFEFKKKIIGRYVNRDELLCQGTGAIFIHFSLVNYFS